MTRFGKMAMRRMAAILGACGSAAALTATPAQGQTLLGPTPYTGFTDSPFNGGAFSYFHLEDFQDGLVNTPGLSQIGGAIFQGPVGSLSDSVEFTPLGGSLFAGSGATGLQILFSAAVLGNLPTHAGLVWTDGRGTITFEAFDGNGVSLGTLTGDHADTGQTGQTGEDRFYGVTHAGGIARLLIRNSSGGIEIDHVQYGLASVAAVPEPATWAMMVLGFGAAGMALRTRRRRGDIRRAG